MSANFDHTSFLSDAAWLLLHFYHFSQDTQYYKRIEHIRWQYTYSLYWIYYVLIYYRVVCPACQTEFINHEKYINHVFEKHGSQPSLRMKAKIIKKEDNTDCLKRREIKG